MSKFSSISTLVFIIAFLFSEGLFAQAIIINEVSNGTGTQEYVELVVMGPVHCDAPPDSIDIRNWIIDDNNAYFSTSSSGTGVAPGVCRFSNDIFWSNIPTGTLIVIYNGSNKNVEIGADDYSMSDGNCSLVLPLSSSLFERNDNQPNSTTSTYPTTGWVSGGNWNTVAMSNTNDSYQIRDANNMSIPVHAVSYNNNDQNTIIYFPSDGGSTVFYFENTVDDDPFNQNSWVSGSTTSNDNVNGPYENGANDQTPGFPNSTNNEDWLITLNHNCTLPPTVYAGEDDTICATVATLTAIGGGASAVYDWNNGLGVGTTQNVSPAVTTEYIVTMTENGWCVTDTVVVVVGNGVTFTLSSTDPTACGAADGTITILGLDANLSHQITYDDGTIQGPTAMTSNASGEIIISGLSAGTYTDFIVDLSGCPSTDNTIINLIDPNGASIDAGLDQTVCNGENVTLTASNPDGAALTWSGGITDGLAFTPALGTTTYTISATLNGCTSTDDVDVVVNPLPTVDAGNTQTICEGENVTLTAINPNGATLSWDNGITDGLAFSPSVGTLTYTVAATLNSCVSTDNVDVTVNPLPTFTLSSADPLTCGGTDGSITISGLNNNTTYQITYNDGSVQGPTAMTTSASGEITISGLDAGTYTDFTVELSGCATVDNTNINLVDPNGASIDAGNNQSICIGEFVTLTASNPDGAVISWDNGITDGTSFSPAVGTLTYTVSANLNGCISTDAVDVTVYALPVVDAGADQAVCEGDNVTLTASNPDGATLTWDNAVTNSVAFSPVLGNLTYTVTASLNSCISTDNVDVTVNPLPAVDAGVDQTICEGDNATLTATNPDGAIISWDNGVVDGIAFLSPTGTNTYTVSANLNACISIDVVDITVNSLPTFNLSSDNPTTCGGNDASISLTDLDANTNYQVSYNNGSVQGPIAMMTDASGVIIILNLNASVYTNFTVDLLGCANTDNTIITLLEPDAPTVDAGNDQTICENETLILSASNPNNANISWNNGVVDGVAFSPNSGTTTYTVTAEHNNCFSTDVVDVISSPVTPVDAGADVEICLGESTILTASGGDNTGIYSWSNGTFTNSITVSPNATTVYTVTLTQNGCSSTNSVIVNINPVATASLGNDIAICIGDDATISVSNLGGGLSYLWNNGVTDSYQVISPTVNTSYSVSISDGTCSSSDDIYVSVNPLPTPQITGDLQFCEGETTTLSLDTDYLTYVWSNGTYNPTLSIGIEGIVSVTVTDNNGCGNLASTTISPFVNPTLTVQTNTMEGCAPLKINFNTTSSCTDCSYHWLFAAMNSSSEMSPDYTFFTAGTYLPSVTLTTSDGCLVSQALEIKVYPVPEAGMGANPPTVDILNPEIVFENYSEIENYESLRYDWSFGDGETSNNENPIHIYPAVGEYWVDLVATSEHSCVDSASIPVRIDDFFQVYFPDAFTPEGGLSGNQYFYPKGVGANEDNFQMTIFDRWGEPIFETSEFPQGFFQKEQVEGGWNGRFDNSGAFVQNGIYIWRVRIMDNFMVVREYTGTVTVIR